MAFGGILWIGMEDRYSYRVIQKCAISVKLTALCARYKNKIESGQLQPVSSFGGENMPNGQLFVLLVRASVVVLTSGLS